MPPEKFLAFDFGAESGRTMLGLLDKDRIRLEEIHRFPNAQLNISGHIHWDISYLWSELKKGLACAAQMGHRKLSGLGVDTWGVDFGLVGQDDQILGNPYAYRDRRTDGVMEKAFRLMSEKDFYSLTGIQFMQFNSVFQFLSMRDPEGHLPDDIATLLFMPDLFNFLLTGEKRSEYTIASTSQLLNAKTRSWEPEIFEKLGLPTPYHGGDYSSRDFDRSAQTGYCSGNEYIFCRCDRSCLSRHSECSGSCAGPVREMGLPEFRNVVPAWSGSG